MGIAKGCSTLEILALDAVRSTANDASRSILRNERAQSSEAAGLFLCALVATVLLALRSYPNEQRQLEQLNEANTRVAAADKKPQTVLTARPGSAGMLFIAGGERE